jgi:CMP/dCMP kinase
MNQPVELPGIRIITVSGRIASGSTTLAKKLADTLGWKLLEGGELFEKIHRELHLDQEEADKRPDHFDLEYEEKVKKIFKEEKNIVVQSHLAGYDAQGIAGVYKILVEVCEKGVDKTEIRIDRLVNRDELPIDKAKQEVLVREKTHLTKFRRLYADNDPNWVYWDQKYYDLIINTFIHNKEESLEIVLKSIGFNKE